MALLLVLTLAASISPLLTFAHLFQLKEWRWDRLREHMRSEGWFISLFGRLRPMIVFGEASLLQVSGFRFQVSVLYILSTLTALNIVQTLTKKQPYPVWTRKAITLIGTSLLITTFFSFLLTSHEQQATSNLIVALPLLQPFIIALALTLLSPLDFFLKHRVLRRAALLRSQFPHLTVIGITGSAGKTTTKELLAHILGPDRAIATPEHINSELGVAQWLLRKLSAGSGKREAPLLAACRLPLAAIVEMGAYRQGEIATICSVVQPTMGIITNIGTQHIGLFGSQRAIAEAKGELFAALPPNGHAFVNIDTPFAQELRQKCHCPVTLVSATATPANLQATYVEETPNGLSFHLSPCVTLRQACLPDRQAHHDTTDYSTPITVPLHGEHQLGSVLLAIAAAMKCGVPLEEITQKLRTFQPPRHTFSVRNENGISILDDTHNASPESFRAAIEWARHQPHTPKILITPGIIEQGLSSARVHFHCGALAKDIFDEAFILNKKLAHHFAQGFEKPVHHLPPTTYHLAPGSLLALIGRVPQDTIRKFLP